MGEAFKKALEGLHSGIKPMNSRKVKKPDNSPKLTGFEKSAEIATPIAKSNNL